MRTTTETQKIAELKKGEENPSSRCFICVLRASMVEFSTVPIKLQKGKKMAGLTGIEPAISGLTGQRVRPDCTTAPHKGLSLVGGTGLEPMASGL